MLKLNDLVYISGPYTKGNVNSNVRFALLAGEEVRKLGLLPFIPHLCHLWDMMYPHDWQYWMDMDLAWVQRCQALLRLPGESKGADIEVEMAKGLGIPVFYDLESLKVFLATQKEQVA